MLTSPEANDISKCQQKINNHLTHCVTSSKITNSNGIFNSWDQYTLNAFYKYSKDKCVLPQIDQNRVELELSGPAGCVYELKRKWYLSHEIIREKASDTSTTEGPGSARIDTESTTAPKKIYSIMISYSERDTRLCQHLINQLVKEKFSVWAEPVRVGVHRDVCLQIHKADCIILCTSENSYESPSCEKESRYAFQTGKPVFPIKTCNDSLIGWQKEVFEGKLFTQLFGSRNHFDMGFSYLLLQIVRIIDLQKSVPTDQSLLM